MPLNKLIFLQIGLGSMGKRRIRNLLFHKIKPEMIKGFDISKDRCREVKKEFGVKVESNFKKAIHNFNPDVFIISTPPNLHAPYFLFAAKKKKHFFVEVPTTDNGYKQLMPMLKKDFIAAPSCTFRYVPGVLKIKKIIENGTIGKPLSFNHYLGQYLPDWHPYEDYRKIYFAQNETGGAREMFFHELVWLTFLFNSNINKAKGMIDKVSDLEMSADDIYSVILRLKNKVIGNVMIDLLNRKASRTLRIIGSEGTIDWDWLKYEIKIFQAKTKKEKILKLNKNKKLKHYNTTEDIYRAEIKDFLNAICGKKKFPYSFREDYDILQTLDQIKK